MNHWVYRTTDLYHIFRNGYIHDSSVLFEIPMYSNYMFDTRSKRVLEIYSELSPSKTQFKDHFELVNLTGNCCLELTEKQANKFGLFKPRKSPFYDG